MVHARQLHKFLQCKYSKFLSFITWVQLLVLLCKYWFQVSFASILHSPDWHVYGAFFAQCVSSTQKAWNCLMLWSPYPAYNRSFGRAVDMRLIHQKVMISQLTSQEIRISVTFLIRKSKHHNHATCVFIKKTRTACWHQVKSLISMRSRGDHRGG